MIAHPRAAGRAVAEINVVRRVRVNKNTGELESMSGVTVEEWQLLSFFEVEPTFDDPDVPWSYNDALYTVRQRGFTLSFAIAPAYRDVRINIEHDGQKLYEFKAMVVKDVRYKKDRGAEHLEIVVSEQDCLVLRLRPRIELSHSADHRLSPT